MAYKRLDLKDGTTITEDHFKHIEDGIVASSGGLADYLQEEIDLTANTVNAYDGKLSFAFQSDQHLSTSLPNYDQFYALRELAKGGGLDFVCLGGDWIDGAVNEEHKDVVLNYMREIGNIMSSCGTDYFMLKGNHETNFNGWNIFKTVTDDSYDTVAAAECIRNQEFYRIACNHLEGKVVFNELEDYPTYFYKDFDRAKIRVICVNTSDNMDDDGTVYGHPVDSYMRQKQLTWICEKALNFSDKENPQDWAVITLGHASIICSEAYGVVNDMTVLKNVFKAFVNGTSYSGTTDAGTWYELTADVDFSGQGAIDHIAHFQGHIHLDGMVVSYGLTQPNIYVCNSYPSKKNPGSLASSGFTSYERNAEDITGQCFDVVNIDRNTRTIKLTRFGAGSDREFDY